MVTIEEKLMLFSKLLNQSMNQKYEEELHKLEKDIQLKIQNAKEKVDREAEEIIERAQRKAESKYAECLSKSKLVINKEIMALKEKYFQIFMDNLKTNLHGFVQSKEYKTYLDKNINRLKSQLKNHENSEVILCLSTKDFNKYGDYIKKEIEKNHRVSLKTTDIIGGFIALIPSENIKYDLSLESILEDNKTFIMQTLFDALEAGEYNG